MKIFYINIEEFKSFYSKDFLTHFADIELKTEKRFYEYAIGRFLIYKIAKEKYNIENDKIIINAAGKPVFNNSKLQFSLSHSKNIVAVCFDEVPCGFDIEYIKNRNLENLSKYFEKKFSCLEDFYKFWTLKEANFKLNKDSEYNYFSKFKDYYFGIALTHKIDKIEFENVLLNKKTL